MYRYLRNTHLLLGTFCSLLVLLYGVSAVQFAHRWSKFRPPVTEVEVKLTPQATDARAVARELMRHHGVRGELEVATRTASGFTLRFRRTGGIHEVQYLEQTGMAKIRTARNNFMNTLGQLHDTRGMWHDTTLLNIWGGFVAITSLSLILIALSGIYLWFKTHGARTLGSVFLGLSLAYGLGLIVALRL
jgi:hypothetical protein